MAFFDNYQVIDQSVPLRLSTSATVFLNELYSGFPRRSPLGRAVDFAWVLMEPFPGVTWMPNGYDGEYCRLRKSLFGGSIIYDNACNLVSTGGCVSSNVVLDRFHCVDHARSAYCASEAECSSAASSV